MGHGKGLGFIFYKLSTTTRSRNGIGSIKMRAFHGVRRPKSSVRYSPLLADLGCENAATACITATPIPNLPFSVANSSKVNGLHSVCGVSSTPGVRRREGVKRRIWTRVLINGVTKIEGA